MIGFDTEYGAGVCISNQTMRKKNLEFPTKCGSEINKEIIIRIEAEKSGVLIWYIFIIKQKENCWGLDKVRI